MSKHGTSGSGYTSSSSDEDDYVVVFAGRNVKELKNHDPLRFSNKTKAAVITHAVRNAYFAKAMPNLSVFLDLYRELEGPLPGASSKRIVRVCVTAVASLIMRLLTPAASSGLIREEGTTPVGVQVSVALIKHVDNGTFDFAAFQNGGLVAEHAALGRRFCAVQPDANPLPGDPHAVARVVMDALVGTKALSKTAGSGAMLAKPNAHFATEARPGTAADATITAYAESQARANAAFLHFMAAFLPEPESMWPDFVSDCWQWNEEATGFVQGHDYARKVASVMGWIVREALKVTVGGVRLVTVLEDMLRILSGEE